jgi:hypothetical protein
MKRAKVFIETIKTPKTKLLNEMKHLQVWFNSIASRNVSVKIRKQDDLDQTDNELLMPKGPDEPISVDEGFNHPDLDSMTKCKSSSSSHLCHQQSMPKPSASNAFSFIQAESNMESFSWSLVFVLRIAFPQCPRVLLNVFTSNFISALIFL